MTSVDDVKNYLKSNLEDYLSFLNGQGYTYLGCREESRLYGDPLCFMEFVSEEKSRMVVVEFTPTSTSPGGCIQTFIRRPPKEGKGELYNSLQIRVPIKNYFVHDFSKKGSLKSHIDSLNRILSSEYLDTINGKKFKPDNSNPRAM